MIKKGKLYVIFILILLSIFVSFPNKVIAKKVMQGDAGGGRSISDPVTNPDAYKPGPIKDMDVVANKAGVIFDIITTIGIIVAVVTILIIGIKYMIGSVEEKAEYKKTMIPYIIGVVMLAGISGILKVIATIVEGIG